MKSHTHSRQTQAQQGFTLVELMTALLVGMLISLAILASIIAIGKQMRVTTGGSNAQTNAQLALGMLDRSARSAGAGLFSNGELVCSSINMYYNSGGGSGIAVYDGDSLAPVIITDGGDSGSDVVVVTSSSAVGGSGSVAIVKDMPSPSSVFTVNNQGNLSVGDMVLIGVPGSNRPCTLFQITSFNPGGGNCDGNSAECINILHNSGLSDYNPSNPGNYFADAPRYGFTTSGSVIGPAIIVNAGPGLQRTTWRVMCDTLVSYDDAAVKIAGGTPSCTAAPLSFTNASAIAGDIVMMKAQYGLSATTDSDIVTTWTDATGSWATPAAADIPRIRAVRIAMVARSPEPAAPKVVTDACTNPAGVANTGPCTFQDAQAPVVDLSSLSVAAGTTWQNYRYRTFTSVIPLRNVTWNY